MTLAEIIPLLPAIAVLAASASSDLRYLRIPNSHVLLMLGIFVVTAPFVLTLPELGTRLLAASIAFGVGFVLFALRMFGGGDVKMLSALLLLVPSPDIVLFLRFFAGALLISSLGMVVLQRVAVGERLGWESSRRRGHVPVAVSIFLATVCLVLFAALRF
jgi:prepilin peptidase CpaA